MLNNKNATEQVSMKTAEIANEFNLNIKKFEQNISKLNEDLNYEKMYKFIGSKSLNFFKYF